MLAFMNATPVIWIDGLSKRYGDTLAVHDLRLEVRPGEVFGFLGPNGAGKTTTIRILLDLIRADAGAARVLGLDSRRDTVAIKRRVGYLPGELRLYERMTAHELLGFGARVRDDIVPAYLEELAERFRCPLDERIGALSHGNRQKVGVLLAFAHQPELLILDEPTQGLDPLIQHEFASFLREFREQGATVFLSSHDLSEVEQVCDRVGMIREGRMIAIEEVGSLRQRAVHELEIRFAAPPPLDAFRDLPGVRNVVVDGPVLRCSIVSTPDAVLKAATRFTIVDLVSRRPSLEQIFLALYGNGPAAFHPEGVTDAA